MLDIDIPELETMPRDFAPTGTGADLREGIR